MSLLTRETFRSFRRAPMLSALSITTIAFSLFTVGLFGLVAVNMQEALRGISNRVEIEAFLLRGTPPETITLASQDIASFPEVDAVVYVDEDEAMQRAQQELIEFKDAYRDLQVNPLPASLQISLKEGFRDASHVTAVAKRIEGFSFVDDVRFGREWIENLDRLRNLAGFVGLVIGLAFASVAVVIIGVTIRMTVLQRAREIAIMRLVGATDAFIRGPFLLDGAVKGFLGGVLAVVLSRIAFELFRRNSTTAVHALLFFEPKHLLLGILFGVAIGLGGSLVSVGRHLRNV
ncbi:MAG: permease-like cell division protein FtsX [Gemmatimonadales bacterium]